MRTVEEAAAAAGDRVDAAAEAPDDARLPAAEVDAAPVPAATDIEDYGALRASKAGALDKTRGFIKVGRVERTSSASHVLSRVCLCFQYKRLSGMYRAAKVSLETATTASAYVTWLTMPLPSDACRRLGRSVRRAGKGRAPLIGQSDTYNLRVSHAARHGVGAHPGRALHG